MHAPDPLIQSLIVGIFVGGSAAYLGSLMLTRQMALVGDALGHVALPGMGLALLLGLDPSLGAFAFLALGTAVIWKLSELAFLSMETLVGIVFVSSLSLGFLIVPEPELLESLIGDISRISLVGMLISVLLSLLVALLVRKVYPGMMLLSISSDLAAVEGISERSYNFLYLLSVAITVSIGVRVTGSLLVGALVIVPPATARVLSVELAQYARASSLIGAVSSVCGILIASVARFPPGPSIILVNALLFALSLALRSRRRIEH